MPEEVVYYVTNYGYLAIFVLIFLQEIGMPNPFPNELLLIFSGYLSYKGLLSYPSVILTALIADFTGTNILYFLFYYAGTFIIQRKPKWIPVSAGMIKKLSTRISAGGKFSIFFFRLTPFTRGYASVITGLLQIKPKTFLPIAFLSALSWAIIYVSTGIFIGPFWSVFIQHLGGFKYIMLSMLVVLICAILIMNYLRNSNKKIRSGLVIL